MSAIDMIEPEHKRVKLVKDNRILNYDFLVIATGTHTYPEQTPGLQDGEWHESVYDAIMLRPTARSNLLSRDHSRL